MATERIVLGRGEAHKENSSAVQNIMSSAPSSLSRHNGSLINRKRGVNLTRRVSRD